MSAQRVAANPNRWSYVCSAAQIVPNTGVCARVGDRQIAVFCVVLPGDAKAQYFALDNIDPRSGAAVLSRGLIGDLGGIAVVASPIYKQHYALHTGVCIEDEHLSVACHELRVSDGMIVVRVPLPAGSAA